MNTLMPLLEASLRGALLIGALIFLRAPLRRLIGSPWLCALWLIVLVRLLVPGSIHSSWSIFNWWPASQPTREAITAPWQARVRVLPAVELSATKQSDIAATTAATAQSSPINVNWFVLIWAVGAAGAAAHLAWRIAKTWRAARNNSPAQNSNLLAAFESLSAELRGRLQLRETDNLEVPALVGLWRPQIWMPTSWLEAMSVAEMRHVLLHEMGHARRGDLWVQWLFAIAQCIHWFNPAVWLAARLAHADRELACDAWVLRRGDSEEPERYGETLLKAALMLRSRWHLPPAAITMAMSKGSLISRVRSIGQFRPIASWRAIVGSAATALLLGSIATDRLHAQSGTAPGGIPGQPSPAAGTPPANAPIGAGAESNGAFEGKFGLESTGGQISGSKIITGSGTLTVRMPGPQVEIEARFFEMNEAGWKSQGLGGLSAPLENQMAVRGVIDPSELHTFLARVQSAPGGGLDLLSAPRVTTRSGQRAVIEIIREFRYATEFDRDEKGVDGLTPTAFETRNVGVTLEAEPTVNFDGQSVDVLLVPQIVELTGFIRVRTGAPVPITPDPTKGGMSGLLDATLPKDMVVQPIFSTRKVSTSVSLRSGQTLVLGGLKQATAQAGTEPRVLFILITARILKQGQTPMIRGTGAAGSPTPEAIDETLFGAGRGSSGFGAPPGANPPPAPRGIPGAANGGNSGGGLLDPAPTPGAPPSALPGRGSRANPPGIPGLPSSRATPAPLPPVPSPAIPGASPSPAGKQ